MAVTLKIAESGDAGGRNRREKFVALAESRTVNAITKAILSLSPKTWEQVSLK